MKFQETRLTAVNIQECQRRAKECNKAIFAGTLLQEKRDKNGVFKTPHGGTAIVANDSLCRPFVEADDATGIWATLAKQTRITGVWYQVLPRLRVLCWSFYGHTQNNDGSYKTLNDHFVEQLLLISAQFGDIPVILGGIFNVIQVNLIPLLQQNFLGGPIRLLSVMKRDLARDLSHTRDPPTLSILLTAVLPLMGC